MIDIEAGEAARWFALQVKPRHEKVTSTILKNKGYREFLPVYQSRRVWSDRIAKIDTPLFPGYVFCHFDAGKRRTPIVATPGVIQIVSTAGKPTPIEEAEILAIERIILSGLAAEPWPYLKVGACVEIQHGSLAGVEGVLVEIKKRHRLVVSVKLLQRSVAVEIEREWVAPRNGKASLSLAPC